MEDVEFRISTERTMRGSLVHMEGFLDYDASQILRQEFDSIFDSGGVNIVVALDRVTHLDNNTLGVLNNARLRAQKLGGRLAIVCTEENKTIWHTFERTGLNSSFDMFKSSDEANTSLGSSQQTET